MLCRICTVQIHLTQETTCALDHADHTDHTAHTDGQDGIYLPCLADLDHEL